MWEDVGLAGAWKHIAETGSLSTLILDVGRDLFIEELQW